MSAQTRIALGKPGTWMEIQGVVANTPKLYRNGDIGFIDWLDVARNWSLMPSEDLR